MDFDKVSPRSMEYLAKIAESPEKFRELTLQYIATREADNLIVPDFDKKNEWLNTKERLLFKTNLKNKLCVLDFFTYCCINCMHILPRKVLFITHFFYRKDMKGFPIEYSKSEKTFLHKTWAYITPY